MRLKNPCWAAVAMLTVSAALAVGCGDDDGSSSDSSAAAVDLQIGVVAGLTGDAAQVGRSWAESTKLAVDEINRVLEKRGDDSNVELVGTEDSQAQVASAIAGARKLVDIDRANVIAGDIVSSTTIAIAQSVTIPKQVLQLGHGTSPALAELDDDGLVWRAVASDAVQAPIVAQVADKFGDGAKANVAYSDTAWGQGFRDVFKDAWERSGGSVGTEVALATKATGYETEAQKLLQGDPDGWVLAVYCTEWGKLRGPLFRSGQWEAERTVVADAAAYCSPPDTLEAGMGGSKSALDGQAYPAFEALYEANASADAPLQEEGACAFDNVMLAFLAAKAAGSDDPMEVKEKLREVSAAPGRKFTYEQLPEALNAIEAGEDIDYEGVTSGIDWDDNGDITPRWFYRWVADPKGGFKIVGEKFEAES